MMTPGGTNCGNVREYIDGVEYTYTNCQYSGVSSVTPDIIHFSDGYIQRDPSTDGNYSWMGWVYKYALTDHLGNTRVVFSDKNDDGVVGVTDMEQINNYYPFGLNMDGPWNGVNGQYKFQYNQKEWNSDLGLNLNDYGARFYDPTIGIWTTFDKLAEKMQRFSPFNYGFDNPIRFIDPDGNAPEPGFGLSFTLGINGGFSFGAAFGFTSRFGVSAVGFNISARFYDFGLGTTHGTNGFKEFQADFVASESLTFGGGNTSGLPFALNTFNNLTPTGVYNDFGFSLTIGSNQVLNSEGRNQRVGYGGFKVGDFAFNLYNDFFPVLGDRDDRWWTGGGSIQIEGKDAPKLFVGMDVFTGIRGAKNVFGEFEKDPNNPANGTHGTYLQPTDYDRAVNNGMTTVGVGMHSIQFGGRFHMYSQNFIHDNFGTKGRPRFNSNADGL